MTMKTKTLDEQFAFLDKVKFPKESKGMQECHDLNTRTLLVVIKYIVDNNCIMERTNTLGSDYWKKSSLRDFLKYAIQDYDDKRNPTADSHSLKFWRIKTIPTQDEIHQLLQADENEL